MGGGRLGGGHARRPLEALTEKPLGLLFPTCPPVFSLLSQAASEALGHMSACLKLSGIN